jgi:hypothetical protein
MTRHRGGALLLALALLATVVPSAQATDVTCTVNNGAWNGSDSASGSGYPGNDNPDGLTGSYSVDNRWHDSNEYEWCEPSHDWFKETYLRWSSTAVSKLVNERSTHTIQVEQQVYPETSYNYTGGHDSDLPYNSIYVADIFQQAWQHFEEVSFVVNDPGTIAANVNYYGYLQWDQEAENTTNNTSPVLDHVMVQIEYGDKNLNVQNYDQIGSSSKKIPGNA